VLVAARRRVFVSAPLLQGKVQDRERTVGARNPYLWAARCARTRCPSSASARIARSPVRRRDARVVPAVERRDRQRHPDHGQPAARRGGRRVSRTPRPGRRHAALLRPDHDPAAPTRSTRCWAGATCRCGRRRCGGCCTSRPPAPTPSSPSTSRIWTSSSLLAQIVLAWVGRGLVPAREL